MARTKQTRRPRKHPINHNLSSSPEPVNGVRSAASASRAAPQPALKKAKLEPPAFTVRDAILLAAKTPLELVDFLESSLTANQKTALKGTFGPGKDLEYHCVRCHEEYDNATDLDDSCMISGEVEVTGSLDRDRTYGGTCNSCEWEGRVDECGTPEEGGDHYCFVGRHSTDRADVKYGRYDPLGYFDNVVTCREKKCEEEGSEEE